MRERIGSSAWYDPAEGYCEYDCHDLWGRLKGDGKDMCLQLGKDNWNFCVT